MDSREHTPKILRLANGKTLVGMVSIRLGQFEITKPLEMVHFLDPARRHESISLKPWVFFAEEETFVIKPEHVISSATLQPQYHEMYEEVSLKAYNPEEYEAVYEDADVYEEDSQTVQELYDEVMNMFNDTTKRTIH